MTKLASWCFCVLLLQIGNAVACSCGPILSPEEHISRSEYVFLGTAGKTQDNADRKTRFQPYKVTEFVVVDLLKGNPTTTIKIYHDEPDGGNCGVSFIEGENHRIFASTLYGFLFTSECDLSLPDSNQVGWPWSYYRRAAGHAN